MDKKKAFRIGIVVIGAILAVLFTFLLLPRLLIWFLPFVLAYFLTKIIEPAVSFMERRLKIPRPIGAIFGIVFAIGIIGGVVTLVVERLWTEANAIVLQSDAILEKIAAQYASFRDTFLARIGIVESLEKVFSDFGTRLSALMASYTVPALRGAVDVVRAVPSAIVFLVVFLMASYFMSSDNVRIREGLRHAMPEKILRFGEDVLQNLLKALGAYLRAQLLLICITFLELTIGFLTIGGAIAEYALLLALIISLIDAVPILGTGTVLIPWGVYALLVGDIRLGIMLLVLYLICLAVRQSIEPRLVAYQIGLHPLLILFVMYAGLRLVGFFGMILGPILALVIRQLAESGAFAAVGHYIRGEEKTE